MYVVINVLDVVINVVGVVINVDVINVVDDCSKHCERKIYIIWYLKTKLFRRYPVVPTV